MKEIAVIGAGMGSLGQLTLEAAEKIEQADYIIGSARLLHTAARWDKPAYPAVTLERVQQILNEQEGRHVAILVSGDVGFYSAAANYGKLPGCKVQFYPGISSVSAFCAKLQIAWEEVRLVTWHGVQGNLVQEIVRHRQVFCLTGNNVTEIGKLLCEYGLDSVTVYVGENLTSDNEKIERYCAADLQTLSCAPMTVLLFVHEQANASVPRGIPDEQFVRGKVPMTKQEVRAVVLSKLKLTPTMVCWDIGAGTGSVSVEMALTAWQGQVYAVECNAEGLALIEANRKKWRAANLVPVAGLAPAAALALPVPDAVFIGGSKGNLREILLLALKKNPQVRIVATAVTLETVQQLQQLFSELALPDYDVVQLAVSRAEPRGNLHLLQAQNPVFIFSGGGR